MLNIDDVTVFGPTDSGDCERGYKTCGHCHELSDTLEYIVSYSLTPTAIEPLCIICAQIVNDAAKENNSN